MYIADLHRTHQDYTGCCPDIRQQTGIGSSNNAHLQHIQNQIGNRFEAHRIQTRTFRPHHNQHRSYSWGEVMEDMYPPHTASPMGNPRCFDNHLVSHTRCCYKPFGAKDNHCQTDRSTVVYSGLRYTAMQEDNLLRSGMMWGHSYQGHNVRQHHNLDQCDNRVLVDRRSHYKQHREGNLHPRYTASNPRIDHRYTGIQPDSHCLRYTEQQADIDER